ncbi:CAP domain-containing protein [Pseudonocardia sp. RS11V-5]|uniref:CAP domain-containing protein n=1 Tax=Pseudonocardia terrae TaxID=2905831 RepID=UPI001E62DF1F|nr:CAP domain-containing protein [Pseudonocardia terrae]MCE3553030.1 CAP domain-containing protein [Pseudonocardia terrae]
MTGPVPRTRALPLLAGLALGALLAALGVTAVVPDAWSVALAGDVSPDPGPAPATATLTPAAGPAPPAGTPFAAPAATTTIPPPTTAVPAATRTTATTTPPRPTPTITRPAPTTAPHPVAAGPVAEVVALTNRARAEAGCAALTTDARITRAAQAHSDDMAARDYFEHDSPEGRSFADRVAAAGYPAPGAENIAMGQRTAQAVVQAWLDSPGHRRNIEDCSLTTIGVGLSTDGYYWTQDFGR